MSNPKEVSATVKTYKLYAPTGKYIRRATMVTFSDGRVVKFLDYIPTKREAVQQALEAVRRG